MKTLTCGCSYVVDEDGTEVTVYKEGACSDHARRLDVLFPDHIVGQGTVEERSIIYFPLTPKTHKLSPFQREVWQGLTDRNIGFHFAHDPRGFYAFWTKNKQGYTILAKVPDEDHFSGKCEPCQVGQMVDEILSSGTMFASFSCSAEDVVLEFVARL
jgi:hypothetical protein